VAKSSKRPAKYDLKAADRKRNLAIQIGLTAVVVIFAVGLVFYIVSNGEKKRSDAVKAVRIVESTSLIKQDGTDEPKAVLSIYEDFQCPHCAIFEQQFGPTVNKLVKAGAVAADYHLVAILDSPLNQNYSTRAANAAYCVAEADTTPDKEVFQRFHSALFAQQPAEGSGNAPDNARLIELARQAGIVDSVPDCINNGNFNDLVDGMAAASKVTGTPTLRINGEDFKLGENTPDDLVAKVKEIVGDIPALDAPAPKPAPAPAP
jgi:protein-disulfide isomerase